MICLSCTRYKHYSCNYLMCGIVGKVSVGLCKYVLFSVSTPFTELPGPVLAQCSGRYEGHDVEGQNRTEL